MVLDNTEVVLMVVVTNMVTRMRLRVVRDIDVTINATSLVGKLVCGINIHLWLC